MALQMRPACPQDREAVFAISSQVWEGHDYLPLVWEKWLHDPAGPVLVAILDDRLVAVVKITLQSPGEAWLEGMRVDPAHRGRGIATALAEDTLRWLAARHVPIARFSTASDNLAVHHLAARLGFRRVVEVQHVARPLELGAPAQVPRQLGPAEEGVAWEMLSGSPFVQATQGLCGVSWVWVHFTRARLQEHLQQGQALAWGQGPDAAAIVAYRSPQVPRYVTMLAGERLAGLALVRSLVQDPYLQVEDPEQPPQLRMALPEGVQDLAWIAQQAGLAARTPWAMWLLQRDAREVRL